MRERLASRGAHGLHALDDDRRYNKRPTNIVFPSELSDDRKIRSTIVSTHNPYRDQKRKNKRLLLKKRRRMVEFFLVTLLV